MTTDAAELNLKEEKTVRVYADISAAAEMKLRLRTLAHQMASGVRMTRKEYLEKLIADDVANVKGASIREISARKMSK